MTKFKDVAHLYLGCKVEIKTDSTTIIDNITGMTIHQLNAGYWSAKPFLRPLSSITDGELTFCGKYLCLIPNNDSKEFDWKVRRTHNTAGILYTSPHYTSPEYFSIWNELNGEKTVGHIEHGWYKYKSMKLEKNHWKRGGCHELTVYLLKQGFDLFGLIELGQAYPLTNQ